MNLLLIVLVIACTFAVCYGLDKGFTKLFRSKQQHKTGLSVRHNKRYGSIGLVVTVLGVAALFTGLREGIFLTFGGTVLILMGTVLVIYYMTFGIFYDQDSFVLTTFGRKSVTYRFCDIRCQQLYLVAGQYMVELQMADGRAVQLQTSMDGVYPFLDKAFSGWMRQKGLTLEQCPFHDPRNSCWFPPVED